MKKIVIIFSILASYVVFTQAQINTSDLLNQGLLDTNDEKKKKDRSTQKTVLSQFHAGVNFPLDNFAGGHELNDVFGEGKGFAAIGFTVGYKLYSQIGVENLSFVFCLDAFYNGFNSDGKDFFDEPEEYANVDITYPKYLNFPATIGLNYAIPASETVKIYGEGGIGANLSTISKASLSGSDFDGYKFYEEVKFTPKVGFIFALEGGVFINQKVSIGLRYNNFGSYKYKYKYEGKEGDREWRLYQYKGKDILNKSLPISNISLRVGIMF